VELRFNKVLVVGTSAGEEAVAALPTTVGQCGSRSCRHWFELLDVLPAPASGSMGSAVKIAER